MAIQLTKESLRQIFPRAPQTVLDAFLAKQDVLEKAGVNHTRTRLSFAFSNVEHECGGFTVKNLTEGTGYTAKNMQAVWPSRFPNAAATAPYVGNPRAMFSKVYGGRMGNRPGTDDGFRYIGRSGVQITGKDGYTEIQNRTGILCVATPELLAKHEYQPEILAGFWDWKKMNEMADVGNFKGAVRRWNGGQIGIADREQLMRGNDPIIARMQIVERVKNVTATLPGAPPTPKPPPEVIAAATKKERAARTAGAGGAGASGGIEAANQTQTGTIAPDKPPVPPSTTVSYLAYGAGALFLVVAVVAVILIVKKRAAVLANWK